jgi:hypothetical protein
LLFFGTIDPLNTVQFSNKRPSTSELNSSCAAKKSLLHEECQSSADDQCSPQKAYHNTSNISDSSRSDAQNLINNVDFNELKDLIVQLLVLFWSASAGNIELSLPEENLNAETLNTSNSSTKKEVKFFIPFEEQNKRLSSGSDIYQHNLLQSEVCLKKKNNISVKDIKIAYKSIEIITFFLQYRKDILLSLLPMKFFNDCLLDVLTGSVSAQIRTYTEQFLFKLNQIDISREFLIQLIFRARLPLWVNSSLTRTSRQRLILQSGQYFNLRCHILDNMSLYEQQKYSIDINKMLNDQINWFSNFTPTQSLKKIDNSLLSGHLSLTKALLTCETADRERIGNQLIEPIIKFYLFPASYLIAFPTNESEMTM